MSNLSVVPFEFEKNPVRVVLVNDEPWFVASDVCKAINASNTTMALQPLDDDERSKFNLGRQGRVNIINESGMFTLILRSREATTVGTPQHRFRKWVTSEVLPSIRKQGHYSDTADQITTLLGQTIGTDGFRCLGAVLEGKLKHLSPALRKSAKQHIWSQVHKAFSVVSAQDIPAASLDSARNFIGSYVLEGEYIARPEELPKIDESKLTYYGTWSAVARHRYHQLDNLSCQLNDLTKRIAEVSSDIAAVKSDLYDPLVEAGMSLSRLADRETVKRQISKQDFRRPLKSIQ